MNILVTYNIPREGLSELEKNHNITYPTEISFSKEEIIRVIHKYDALLSIFCMPIDKDIINAGKNLKIISNYGVGFNNIDIKTASKNGICVCNTPESVCKPTAEHTIGLMLSTARRISECNHLIKDGNKLNWGVMKNLGVGLYGKTIGIIGMGRIGREVARICQVFGVKILYNKRSRLSLDVEKKLNAQYCSLEKIINESDFISLHTPLTKETRNLISYKELEKMKPSAILINTARGGIVNEEALAYALQKKSISGAALDVFEDEPKINNLLYSCDNAILVPHLGTATMDARIEMGKEASKNIISFFEGKTINIVN